MLPMTTENPYQNENPFTPLNALDKSITNTMNPIKFEFIDIASVISKENNSCEKNAKYRHINDSTAQIENRLCVKS